MQDVLTVIPAKLGSIRLPRKNILPLCGKPMVAYAIKAARDSGVCGEVMVSTESPEVADIARECGAAVPFLRPAVLGRNPHGVVDVCMHVLDAYEQTGRRFRTLAILLPTAPLRTAEDVRRAMETFSSLGASFLMTVSPFEHNPYSALRFVPGEEGRLTPCFPEWSGRMASTLPPPFRPDGAVCIVDVAAFRKAGTYYGDPLHASVTPWPNGLDVDTLADFELAEFYLSRRLAEQR